MPPSWPPPRLPRRTRPYAWRGKAAKDVIAVDMFPAPGGVPPDSAGRPVPAGGASPLGSPRAIDQWPTIGMYQSGVRRRWL